MKPSKPANPSRPKMSGPGGPRANPPAAAATPAASKAPVQPLSEAELEALEARLDALPRPLEPLDIGMLDGFLVGVLLQPKAVQKHQWLPYVLDSEARPAPAGFDSRPLTELVLRRYQELNRAIVERQWFDPWVFELDDDANPSEAVMPWVAGFSLATEIFPELMRSDASQLLEPLASLYMHIDPEDLEDADDALLEEIESLEPPADMAEAVESLVRSTLLLADITRPIKTSAAPSARQPAPRRGPPSKPPRGRY